MILWWNKKFMFTFNLDICVLHVYLPLETGSLLGAMILIGFLMYIARRRTATSYFASDRNGNVLKHNASRSVSNR